MDRFVSTFTNKIDAKGRVSVPASFRAVLERDGYSQGGSGGIYCYPSLDAPALDAGGERLAQKIDGLLAGLPDYSDERDELSVALYGDVQVLVVDQDGRIVLPEALRRHAGIATHITFVGLGEKFQMWEPGRFEARRAQARAKVQQHRTLFGAGRRRPGGTAVAKERGNDDGARQPDGGRRRGGAAPSHSRAAFRGAGGARASRAALRSLTAPSARAAIPAPCSRPARAVSSPSTATRTQSRPASSLIAEFAGASTLIHARFGELDERGPPRRRRRGRRRRARHRRLLHAAR